MGPSDIGFSQMPNLRRHPCQRYLHLPIDKIVGGLAFPLLKLAQTGKTPPGPDRNIMDGPPQYKSNHGMAGFMNRRSFGVGGDFYGWGTRFWSDFPA